MRINYNLNKQNNGNAPEEHAAIRVGQWKLIEGNNGRGDWYGTDPSLAWQADYIMGPDATNYELLKSGGPFGDMKTGDVFVRFLKYKV